jgi:hypothetical protein
MRIQVTLFDINEKLKPIACVLEVESLEYARQNMGEIKKKAYNKIASKRYLTATEIFSKGYQKMKMREYDPDKIKKENKIKFLMKEIEKKRGKQNEKNNIERN